MNAAVRTDQLHQPNDKDRIHITRASLENRSFSGTGNKVHLATGSGRGLLLLVGRLGPEFGVDAFIRSALLVGAEPMTLLSS